MDQPAQLQFPIHDLFARRWSPRAFDERPVETQLLRSLFEAARWAPSSNNEQPWRFIVASKEHQTDWNRLFECLAEGNRRWAFRAPVLVLSVASMYFEDDGKPNRHAL
ncbi:MAG: nitroreductase family protein, partial [Nitrospira sp.]|nr:nitroreductase family protein [Nitrospira sp.]